MQRLLPSYSRQLEEAATAAQEWNSAITKSDSASSELQRLQRQRQQYLEWEQSPSTQEMCRNRDYLQTPERQQLIAEALELERQRKLERPPAGTRKDPQPTTAVVQNCPFP